MSLVRKHCHDKFVMIVNSAMSLRQIEWYQPVFLSCMHHGIHGDIQRDEFIGKFSMPFMQWGVLD
jgi:hypothetical protein